MKRYRNIEPKSLNYKDTIAFADAMQMIALVNPDNDSDESVSWSVLKGTYYIRLKGTEYYNSEQIATVDSSRIEECSTNFNS
jgi:hypothetical protein